MIRVGIDLQALQTKAATGFGYYVRGLYPALLAAQPSDLEIIGLKSRLDRDLSTPERWYHDAFELPRLAEAAQVDVLHQPTFSCPKSKAKVVWTLHDLRPLIIDEAMSLTASLYWRHWLPHTSRYADMIVCTSEHTRQDAFRYLGLSAGRIEIIPLGVPEAVLTWPYNAKTAKKIKEKFALTKPYFTSLGTIQPSKNFPFLIDVFAALRRQYALDYQLVIIGRRGWDYPALARRLAYHHLQEGQEVIVTDYVSDNDKWALLHDSEVFLFPSRYEGFGIPPLEAQALNIPVIASNVSSIPWVVGDGGLLANPAETKTWVTAYETLIKSRQELIAAGKANLQRFRWAKIAEMWLALYRAVGES